MTLKLSGKARKAFDSICDAFVPGENRLPSATELGVPEAMLEAVGQNPSQAERDKLAGLLEAWDTELAGSDQSPFSAGSQAERERTLLAWADAPEAQSRAAFQALRKGVLLTYYTLPWSGEGPNPVDEALGYPEPLGPPADPPPKTIKPLEVTADTELDCDVCVVGSGAGGGTAAGVLAAAGLDVVVVEAGGYYSEEDIDGAELMQALRYTVGYGALQRARDGGEVVVGRDGLPTPRWSLSDFDREVMRRGLDGAAQILEAGGAQRIYSSHAGWVAYEPRRNGSRERLLEAADRCGWGTAQVTLGSFHLMGTARMGSSPDGSVCDASGETWDVKDFYVVDGAVLPTALGVNPMVTIEAAAHKIARGMTERLS